MGKTPSNASTVSPKVTASTLSGAAAVVIAWVVTQVPFLADAPAAVQLAIVTLLVAAATFVAGYFRRDPARF